MMKKPATLLTRFNKLHDIEHNLNIEAKLYILENCEKVIDWSRMHLEIKNGNSVDNDNKLKKFHYCPNYQDTIFDKLREKYLPNHQSLVMPDDSVKTVTDPVYDECDGDFSITINGLEWWWIDRNAVKFLALYIERELASDMYVKPKVKSVA